MAFKTFAPGVLTSSDVNTFLMRQSVITCTAATRPASPNEGMTIFETDTDATLQFDGTNWIRVFGLGAYETFTPTMQSKVGTAWQIGNGTIQGRFYRIGTAYVFQIAITIGSTTVKGATGGGVNNALTIGGLPLGFAGFSNIGWGYASDLSTSTPTYLSWAEDNRSPTVILPLTTSSGASQTGIYATVPFTWDTGDTLFLCGIVEN